ncbi:MAG: hypothetical protein BWZ10_02876 [candidate division BRC1 bacterium ADurb.BinA364]|nr:MAG: hypothetical protein BWZ10_02876 [candidate division BRC1 bacterium ADurb.BinA364]
MEDLKSGGLVLDFWSEGMYGVFAEAFAAARQVSGPIAEWGYASFSLRGGDGAFPDTPSVSRATLAGDPIWISLLAAAVAEE